MRSVKTPPESRLVSYMMDKTMDELILMMLLQNVSTQGVSFMITDMVDRMMEDHMMQVLLQEFTLLNQLDEKKRLNDAGRADHDESKNKGGSMIFLNHTRVGINLNGGIAVIPPIEVGVAVAEGATATTVGLAGDDREADINEGEDQDGLVLDASAKSNDGTLLSAIEISKSLISF